MPGFPLSAIGAGLGQFAQAYRADQSQALQTMLTRMALQRQQQQQQAESLLGSVPGSTLSGLMGGGGLNLPGSMTMPQAQAPAMPPVASPPQPAALAPAAPPPLDAAGTPTGVMPLDAEGEGQAQARAGEMGVPYLPNVDAAGQDAPESPAVGSLSAGESPAAASPVSADAGAAAGASAEAPITNPILQHILGSSLDLGRVKDAIQAAKPDADPGTVWRATQMIYGLLERGSSAQQAHALQALTQLRLMQGLDLRGELGRGNLAAREKGLEIAGQRAKTAAELGQGNLAERKRASDLREKAAAASASARAASLAERKREFDQRMAEASGARDVATRTRILTSMLGSLDRQLGQLRMQIPPDRDAIATLTAQRMRVVWEMNKRPGGQYVPVGPPQHVLRGGGVWAPIPPAQ